MDQELIEAIARDAAELGRALAAEGIRTAEAQARIVAGAMPGIVAYETGTYGAWGQLLRAGAGGSPRDQQAEQAEQIHGIYGRTLEDTEAAYDGPPP